MIRRRLLLQEWEEESFELPVGQSVSSADRGLVDPWELEAVGAADDPGRFRVDFENVEAAVPDVQY